MTRENTGSTPVEATIHAETRVNIPTADAADTFFDLAADEVPPFRARRDMALDPQLVWRGKDELDQHDLVVDTPPIYIQEKIDPRVLIENLRRTTQAAPDGAPALWDDFDGLDELEQIEFYQHQANWTNRMVLGDSLQVMASLAEREALRGQVQMIYIDPPYGIKFNSNWQVSARRRDVKDGNMKDAAREAEQIKAFRDTWEDGIHSYLTYLRDRLVAARELLTESGSCFLQIGDENVHIVRSLMDEVFGPDNFVAQIAFMTTTSATATDGLAGVNDYILWFAKERPQLKYRALYFERSLQDDSNYRYRKTADGCEPLGPADQRRAQALHDAGEEIARANPLTSQSGGETTRFAVEHAGRMYLPASGGWKTNEAGMRRLQMAGRLMGGGRTLSFVRPFRDFPYQTFSTVWSDTRQSGFGETKTYVVQTSAKVIERCMLMSTDPGDLVLDPTCGSGTTAFVAEQWGRRWITIDTSRVALALARQRIMGARYPFYLKADSVEGRRKESALTGQPLPLKDTRGDIRKGFVYERVQHVTLKSIANNPDIREGMSRDEIDDAIRRHADSELLFDKPYEDKKKVRVSGPFTVESLSPYRSVEFEQVDAESRDSGSAHAGAVDPEGPNFEQSILDNLLKAGVQNGRRDERIEFANLDAHAGRFVQAIGERWLGDASGSKVAVAIGPQYGTVSAAFIKQAAREALQDEAVELLCVLGFAFDPGATGVTEADGLTVETTDSGFAEVAGERRLGRIKVLIVRMNADLLMADALKNTKSANLFTVFGEPDIEITRTDAGNVVELHGVDVYDPTLGEVRSRDTGRIALWMIDTEYDGESFFVRHCYFTGDNDPYKKLKTALKADIDEDAWAALNRTVSLPFPSPSTGRIAVKVINDYGDEVMKVFPVD